MYKELNKYLLKYPHKRHSSEVQQLLRILESKKKPQSPTIMANIPAPTPYNVKEDWKTWDKNLASYLSLINVTEDASKKNMLLYLIGQDKRAKIEDYINLITTDAEGFT